MFKNMLRPNYLLSDRFQLQMRYSTFVSFNADEDDWH
jgi:hypothetical protein